MNVNAAARAETENSHREEVAQAVRSWHRGDKLSQRELDLIDQANRETLRRAFGVSL